MEPNLTPTEAASAVPAALTSGYNSSWLDTLQRITIARAEPPVLTQADLNTLDGVQA